MLRRILAVLLLLSAVGFAQVMTNDSTGEVVLAPASTDPSGLSTTVTSNFIAGGGGNNYPVGWDPIQYSITDVFTSGPMIDDGTPNEHCFAQGQTSIVFNGGDVFSTLASNVSFSGASAQIVGTNDGLVMGVVSSKLYQYNPATGQWSQKTAPASITQVTAGIGAKIYALGATVSGKNIYKLGSNGTWSQPVPGVMTEISVGDDGGLWAGNSTGTFRLVNNTWVGPIASPSVPQQIVARTSTSAYILGTNAHIYQYSASSQSFTEVFAPSPTTYPIKEIGIYNNGMYAITTANILYRYVSGAWQQVIGQNARHLSVGGPFDVYTVNGNGYLIRFLPTSTKTFVFNANGTGTLDYHATVSLANTPDTMDFARTISTTVNGSYCAGLVAYSFRASDYATVAYTRMLNLHQPPYDCSPTGVGTEICLIDGSPWCTAATSPPLYQGTGVADNPDNQPEAWDAKAACFRLDPSHPWFCKGFVYANYYGDINGVPAVGAGNCTKNR